MGWYFEIFLKASIGLVQCYKSMAGVIVFQIWRVWVLHTGRQHSQVFEGYVFLGDILSFAIESFTKHRIAHKTSFARLVLSQEEFEV